MAAMMRVICRRAIRRLSLSHQILGNSPVKTVVDTNVFSELFIPAPNPVVVAWVAAQRKDDMLLTSIVEAELWSWAAIKKEGKRRDRLIADITTLIDETFGGRVLRFDRAEALMFSTIYAERRAAGRSLHFADIAIAAIARLHNAAVATNNTKHFIGSGVEVIDPWEAAL